MNKTMFTPGPWQLTTVPFELRNTDSAAAIYGNAHGTTDGSALICDISRSAGDEQATANARLIAAAPEMYELLERGITAFDEGSEADISKWLQQASDLLSRINDKTTLP